MSLFSINTVPVLYPEDATVFANWGIGSLWMASRCEVTWQLNGKLELVLDYPVTGARFPELLPRRIIRTPVEPGGTPQPFRIYRVTAPLRGSCTVYARHIACDLMGYTLAPFSASSLAEAVAMLNGGAAVQAHGYTVEAGFSSDTACKSLTPRSVWSMLGGQRGSLLDVYGGEWEFDGFTLRLRERIGADRGVIVRYAKNLKTLEQDTNVANTWTAVQPYWLSLDETVCVTLPEHTVSAGEFDYTRVLILDLSAEWAEAPTEEQLRARAREYISDNSVGTPSVGLDVDFVPLDQTEQYRGRAFLSKVSPGDTVQVEFPSAYDKTTGAPSAFVRATSRVVETVYQPLQGRYKRVRLGEKRADFVTAMATIQKNTAWLMRKVR